MEALHAKSSQKKILSHRLGPSLCLLAAALGAAGWLIWPEVPSSSKTLEFQGFIVLPESGPWNVLDCLTLDHGKLFVASETSGAVYRIGLPGRELPEGADVSVMRGPAAAHDLTFVSPGGPGFVSRSESDSVDAFDRETMQTTKRIPVAEDADAILYDPETELVYVANGESHFATLIDPKKMQSVGTIALGGKPAFPALHAAAHLLYQNLQDTNEVAAVDLRSRHVTARWKLQGCEGPSGMAIDQQQRRLLIACFGNDRLAVFALDSHSIIAMLPVGGGPDSVAFDPSLRRIYIAGKTGVLTVVHQRNGDLYDVIDSVRTHYGAHTVAVDPGTHNVFLAYASLFVPPRIAVFTAKP